jgi:flagellar biosynthesis/type III secretory pathway M-ring protein FliF/YscJ
LDSPLLAIKGQPTTVGQLAEANTKKMGHYELQEKENRDNKELRKAKKETRKSQRSINKMTPDQQKKYIIEGD